MKKVKITGSGLVQTLDERRIDCPLSYDRGEYAQCGSHCMWFNTVISERVDREAGDITKITAIMCKGEIVAELVEDKP